MTQVGWFVVGFGKFGEFTPGRQFLQMGETHEYWTIRGYEVIPVFINAEEMQ